MQTAELTCLIFLGSERTREGSGAGRQSCVSLPWQRHTSRLRAASHVIMCRRAAVFGIGPPSWPKISHPAAGAA